MSRPEEIYSELTELLKRRKSQIYDIEILPFGFSPLMHDGLSIGITKEALVQAFIVARGIFFDALKIEKAALVGNTKDSTEEYPPPPPGPGTDEFDGPVSLAGEVMLLFDPEHLTACNWRKRRLLRVRDQGSPEQIATTTLREITFTTTLLRSPLHRHAKSPTLWSHRYWVISTLPLGTLPNPVHCLAFFICGQNLEESPYSILETAHRVVLSELSVVLKSAEHHPMNYYGFSYMRQLLELVLHILTQSSDHKNNDSLKSRGYQDNISQNSSEDPLTLRSLVTKDVLEKTHLWCLSHPGDVSGWSFLRFLLKLVDHSGVCREIVEKTMQFAIDIAWDGEALWSFVDNAIRQFRACFERDIIEDTHAMTANYAKAEYGQARPRHWEARRSWAEFHWKKAES
ncbi:hypothetical protein VTO42DRAFT_6283 [Malbranchea cinnamomea]